MESLIVPALILVAVVIAVLLLNRSLSRRATEYRAAHDAASAPVDAVELARESAAKLSEEQHRRLYSLIAQGQAMAAIKLYLSSTGEGLRASRDAVAALAAHPQPFRQPEPPPADLLPEEVSGGWCIWGSGVGHGGAHGGWGTSEATSAGSTSRLTADSVSITFARTSDSGIPCTCAWSAICFSTSAVRT